MTVVTKDLLTERLNALGSTPDEVADTLRFAGYKGDHAPNNCPVANYLRDQFPGEYVSVGWVAQVQNQLMMLPSPVETFVTRFDDGKYPKLETLRGKIGRILHLK